jgi:REP element-mobilizing transposase RayT
MALKNSLATVIGAFKSTVTRRLKRMGMTGRVWQRNYYEHIIRNDHHLWAIRRYIITNPARWHDPRKRT